MAFDFQKGKYDERRGRSRQAPMRDDTSWRCQRERESGFGVVKLVLCLICGHITFYRCHADMQIFVPCDD
ncbi:hypothetical protein PF005_g1168 [Phytophthora fragariae]|uniref:Uncharacterized protein n=1 Tax=Phytophthora fragariae TaxID=53985 RepID=A0A6A3UP24_9STRA|nr:hypothetical protein PF003_g334 [Phytophthora fragariae]KAE8949527.1 hypothetical protein PF009_g935 [Phytophthora fragariae]KAE9030115.1 hypothetical protein PF011_g757 [Phytophthora fragariae]KAE9133179.1 hypothetical protein PF007_g3443 [Phytophthora fragariae]KAE9133790.1 hypothetical protein PF010_g2687 [Phytophthora fragariae]